MNENHQPTGRFARKSQRKSIKALRRSSSFAKNLPRKSLNQQQSSQSSSLSFSQSSDVVREVWIEEGEGQWVLCQKIRQENSSMLLKNLTTNSVFSIDTAFKEVFPHDPNVSADMITLRGLSEPSILYNLKERSLSKNPYTYMGTVLISVNPFEWYEFPELSVFKGKILDASNPHPYAIAEYAYQQICSSHAHDHAVVISGESGAGKTENAHMVLSYTVNRATSSASHLENIEERLLKSSPILEAFGNAKTSRNANSSRFGKYMKIYFNPTEVLSTGEKQRRISHASVETYLLEKSRVTSQIIGEENFHVFYVLLAAIGAGEQFTESIPLSSNRPTSYSILTNATELSTKKSTEPTRRGSLLRQSSFAHDNLIEQYHAVINAMQTLGYNSNNILSIWKTVGAILELGNIQFVNLDTSEGQISHIENEQHVNLAAELLGINPMDLINIFTKRIVTTVGEKITKSLTSDESIKTRNAFIKGLYSNLFNVLVSSINTSLANSIQQPNCTSIGILDIFGFESFERNEFEQLLINYANEALQNTFNEQIFLNELKLYKDENVKVNISLDECPSNSACVNLIYSKTSQSIISILQTVAQSPKASDEMFCENLHKTLSLNNNPLIKRYFPTVHPKDRKVLFSINHFAGTVTYHVGEKGLNTWLNKNHDTIPDDMYPLLLSSNSEFVQSLGSASASGSSSSTSSSSKQRKQSIADVFSQSMTELCQTLKQSNCSFIRCIKPNKQSLACNYDSNYVVHQLRALGLVQVCEVMKVGLTKRISFEELRRLNLEVTNEITKLLPNESSESISAILMWALDISDDAYYIGKTRVFFKSSHCDLYDRLLDTRSSVTPEILERIQQAIKLRIESKTIIDNLENQFKDLMKSFTHNQSSIQQVLSNITSIENTFTSLTKENRIIASIVPKIIKKFSTTEKSVQDIKEHVEEFRSHSDYSTIQELLTLIETQLNSCDDIWTSIDTNSTTLTSYLTTQPTDLLKNCRAEISNELSTIEELFPEVHYLINKTVEQANRCQLNKLEQRSRDCEFNIDLIKQRLEINSDDLHSIETKVTETQEELNKMNVLGREISSQQQQALTIADNILKLCTDIRKKTSMIRMKMIRDEEERVRVENEIKEKEERLKNTRLQEEEEAKRIQDEQERIAYEAEIEELKRIQQDDYEEISFDVNGLELPSGWEWNNERKAYFNVLTKEYQVEIPTQPAMTSNDTGVGELLHNSHHYHKTGNEKTEYDFDGIRIYTFVDTPTDDLPTNETYQDTFKNQRHTNVIIETIPSTDSSNETETEYVFDSAEPSQDSSSTSASNKKVIKELSYMCYGLRVDTTKEISEREKQTEMNDEREDNENEAIEMAKNVSLTTELTDKISRIFYQGYLQKQGKYFGSWRRLYFVLSGNSISHYHSKQSYQCGALPTKIIQLTGLSVLSYTRYNLCFTVHTGGRTSWTMMTENKKEFRNWMDRLNTVIGTLFDTRIQSCLQTPWNPRDDAPELF